MCNRSIHKSTFSLDEINAILNNLYSAERHLRIIIDHLSHKNVKGELLTQC